MKPEPREMIEGPTAWERFREAAKVIVSVPKDKIIKAEKRKTRSRSKSKSQTN